MREHMVMWWSSFYSPNFQNKSQLPQVDAYSVRWSTMGRNGNRFWQELRLQGYRVFSRRLSGQSGLTTHQSIQAAARSIFREIVGHGNIQTHRRSWSRGSQLRKKQMWAKRYSACIECGTTTIPHKSNGRCIEMHRSCKRFEIDRQRGRSTSSACVCVPEMWAR